MKTFDQEDTFERLKASYRYFKKRRRTGNQHIR